MNKEEIRRLIRQSHKATCGITERELTVPSSKKGIVIRKLKAHGYRIVGTSYNDSKTTKIWFIMRGMNL